MLAVRFYDVIVALHVLAVFAAFGVVFAYPVLVPYVLRRHPRSAPGLFGGMAELNRRLVTPAATVALLAGAYLASDAEAWDEVWVGVPLLCLIVLMGLVGAVFAPTERRLSERTAEEAAGAGDAPAWSAETQALIRKESIAGATALLLVAIAVFFMVAKPFA